MVKDGDSARKRAVECMALATKTSIEERSDILRAMARSWMTLAAQFDRLAATKISMNERESRRANPPKGKVSA